jgi:hypothetical protein
MVNQGLPTTRSRIGTVNAVFRQRRHSKGPDCGRAILSAAKYFARCRFTFHSHLPDSTGETDNFNQFVIKMNGLATKPRQL